MKLINTRGFFRVAIRKQTAQVGVLSQRCFINERRSNSQEHIDCSARGLRRAAETDVAFHSTHWKDIRVSCQLFTRRAVDVIPDACFTAMTGDRYDKPAAMDLSMIAVALTPS